MKTQGPPANTPFGTFLGACKAWNDTARGDQALYYLYWISGNGTSLWKGTV